ncbi:Wzz/FepE/Etk N-terminal domain-containing protein [Endozoicomonas sp. Mp262]|uniref:Wzz/FepE/Etk N-terminal domain-containing protein n=1 Tax=Endozoicomonas sp. Mp262 TaxID=2919499 RepID=UPI0021D9DBB3
MIDDDMISLSDIVSILLNGKKWIIGSVLTCLLGACLYLSVVDSVYRVSTEIKVDPNIEPMIYSMLDIKDIRGTAIASDVEEIKSIGFIDKVIDESKKDFTFSDMDVRNIIDNLSVKQKARGAGIIEIAYSSEDSMASIAFLNAINNYYLSKKKERIFDNLDKIKNVMSHFRLDVRGNETAFDELKEMVASSFFVLKSPLVDSQPIRPKSTMIVIMAIILGGMLGIVLVFTCEAIRSKFRTPEEVKRKTGIDVLAVIPNFEKQAKIENDVENNSSLEAIRALRTNLLFKISKLDSNRVMVCSPFVDTGKEYAISQLAILLAKAGKNTLLVDADIRNGKIFERFNIINDKGLSDCLADCSTLSVINIAKNIDVISGRKYPDNPSELLMSESFDLFLEKASDKYDVVLINLTLELV